MKRRREDLIPEETGLYLLGALLAGIRTGVYRLLFNYYVVHRGYEEGLITVLITASVMAMVISVLPMSYLVDFAGKKRSLYLGIGGTFLCLLIMVLFPSRWVFLIFNILLGMYQALTQVSLGSEDTRYLRLFERVIYYLPSLVLVTLTNYAAIYIPQWIHAFDEVTGYENQLYIVGLVSVALFVFIDSQYTQHTRGMTPKRVITRFNIGGVTIPLIIDSDEDEEEDFSLFNSVAEQVNFILQGLLLESKYAGPEIQITENLEGDLLITVEGMGEYFAVDHMPDGEARSFVQQATDLWVKQNYKE